MRTEFENLVAFDYTHKNGDISTIRVNTTMLLRIYFVKGYRLYGEHRRETFLRKKFVAKYPRLSKYYNPHRNIDYFVSKWIKAKVYFDYGNEECSPVLFSSNAEAEIFCRQMKEKFFGI